MFENNLLLWYCTFLLIGLSLELQRHSTNDEEKNNYSTVQHQLDANITLNQEEDFVQYYNLRENLTKDIDNTQYAYRINFTSNLEDEDLMYLVQVEKNENNSQMAIEFRSNSTTDFNDKKNFMTQEIHENLNRIKDKNDSTSHNFLENFNKDNIVSNKTCNSFTCVRLCCPFDQRLINGKCVAIVNTNYVFLPNMLIYMLVHNDTFQVEGKKLINEISLFVDDPCQKTGHYSFDRYSIEYVFIANGSLYLLYYNAFIKPTSYCLAVVDQNKFVVNVCLDIMQNIMNNTINSVGISAITKANEFIIALLIHVGNILTSLVMFMVYSMPELRNIQGFTLCGCSSLYIIGNIVELLNIVIRKEALGFFFCTACAYIKYYCFVGYFFWLNILNFDMWCAFRQIRSLQGNTKQQEKKKLIRYSLYAFGGPFMLIIICAIMDFVPGLPENLIRPGFVRWHDFSNCWFHGQTENLLYFQGVRIISILISIFLSICTSRKISLYQGDVAHQLKDSENRRFNDNRQWFKLTVNITTILFIIMCIRSYMVIIYSAHNEVSYVVHYTNIAMEAIQSSCIFIIFVCKKKIMQLLLKRFDCWKCGTSCKTKTTTID